MERGSLLDRKRGNDYTVWRREGGREGGVGGDGVFEQGCLSALWPPWFIEIKLLWPKNSCTCSCGGCGSLRCSRWKAALFFPFFFFFAFFATIIWKHLRFSLWQKRTKRTISRHHAPDAIESYYQRYNVCLSCSYIRVCSSLCIFFLSFYLICLVF